MSRTLENAIACRGLTGRGDSQYAVDPLTNVDDDRQARSPSLTIHSRWSRARSPRASLSGVARGSWHANLSAYYVKRVEYCDTRPRQIFWQRSKRVLLSPEFFSLPTAISRADVPTFFLPGGGIRDLMPRRLAGLVINVGFINKWKSRAALSSRYILSTCQGRDVLSCRAFAYSGDRYGRVLLPGPRSHYARGYSYLRTVMFTFRSDRPYRVHLHEKKNRYVQRHCNLEIDEFHR